MNLRKLKRKAFTQATLLISAHWPDKLFQETLSISFGRSQMG